MTVELIKRIFIMEMTGQYLTQKIEMVFLRWSGHGGALNVAVNKDAYILSDRSTGKALKTKNTLL